MLVLLLLQKKNFFLFFLQVNSSTSNSLTNQWEMKSAHFQSEPGGVESSFPHQASNSRLDDVETMSSDSSESV